MFLFKRMQDFELEKLFKLETLRHHHIVLKLSIALLTTHLHYMITETKGSSDRMNSDKPENYLSKTPFDQIKT